MTDEDYSHSIDKVIKYKTDDAVCQVHDYNLDLKANHIYLVGETGYIGAESEGAEPGVEYAMANRFIKNLNILMRKSDEPILIHMKTCGGDWCEGMAIYDAIKACPNQTTILSYTHARSMSSLIFLAADKRVMMPHSIYMIHQGDMGYEGTYKQYMTDAAEGKRVNEEMFEIYVDTMKSKGKMKTQSRNKIRAWLDDQVNKKEEVYFTSEQAVEYGFCDGVFGADGQYDWATLTDFSDSDED